ncbi:reverse transcriptase domain, reverse transcriptase zinc-binding domain protein [Tanacetum coccineum]
MEAGKSWLDKDTEYRSMLQQKARIRWDVKGDENLKFFHSYIKRRKNKNNIRGFMVNGLWCEYPSAIKAEMVEKILVDDAASLEKEFLEEEIVDAIRICRGIKPRVKENRSKGLIFKANFKKAYDYLKWRFLIDIINKMGFGERWCKWVDSCLRSSSMSNMVNGSPTEEFCLERGARQGVPLSPFLFILAAKGLNVIVKEVVVKGVFKGVKFGSNNVVVSHIQYADDTIFFGEWNKQNAKVLLYILKCFEEVSGLRVNYNKSKLYGVGVSDLELRDMARWMRCSVGDFPFTYLGLLIGDNMRRVGAWNSVIKKFKNCLAEWKAKSMSFRRRLTLVKSVL